MKSEFIWIWLPLSALSAGVIILRKMKKNHLSS
jgi:hypothetical protein